MKKERRLAKWIHCKIGFVNTTAFTSELFLFFNVDGFPGNIWAEIVENDSIVFDIFSLFILFSLELNYQDFHSISSQKQKEQSNSFVLIFRCTL